MATTFATPSADVGSLDAGSPPGDELTSAVGEAYDSAIAAEDGGESQGEPQGSTGEGAAPSIEEPAEPATPQVESAEASAEPYPLSQDGLNYLIPKEQLAQIQAAQQFQQELSGVFSNAQEATVAAQEASNFRRMMNDWGYGTPDSIKGILNYWAGAAATDPAYRAKCAQSFGQMALMMPEMLQGIHPQAHAQLSQQFVQRAIDSAYQKAAQTGSPEDFQAAQHLDWGATGQYKTELPKVDPAQARISEFQQREAAFNQRQNAAYQRDVNHFSRTVLEDGGKYAILDQKLEGILKDAKSRFSSVAYEDLKTGIKNELTRKMQEADRDWFEEHRQAYHGLLQDYRMTWDQGNPGAGLKPRVDAYVQSFVSRAMRLLPSIAQARLSAATQTKKALNGAASGTQTRPPQGRQGASAGTAPQSQNGQGSKRLSPQEWDTAFKDALTVR